MPYLWDLHCHTNRFSFDAVLPPEELIRRLVDGGFSGVCITEHNHAWTPAEIDELRAQSAAPPSFIILSGQEIGTATPHGGVCGDVLAYGLQEDVPDGTEIRAVFQKLRAAGGFAIAPHAAVPRKGVCEVVNDYPFAALESWNGRYGTAAEAAANALANRHGILTTGGSDAHRPEDVCRGGTLLESQPKSLEDLRRILESGAARPWKPPGSVATLGRLLRRILPGGGASPGGEP